MIQLQDNVSNQLKITEKGSYGGIEVCLGKRLVLQFKCRFQLGDKLVTSNNFTVSDEIDEQNIFEGQGKNEQLF